MQNKIYLVLSLIIVGCGANVTLKAQPKVQKIEPLLKTQSKQSLSLAEPKSCTNPSTYFEVAIARLGNDTALREFCTNPIPQKASSTLVIPNKLLQTTDLISGHCLQKNCSSPLNTPSRIPLEPTVLRAIVDAATYDSISVGNMQKHLLEEDPALTTEEHEEVSKHKVIFNLNADTQCISKNLSYSSEVIYELFKGTDANKSTKYYTDAYKFYKSLELDELFYTYYSKDNLYKIVMTVDVSYEAHGESVLFKEKTLCQSKKPIHLVGGYFNVYLNSQTSNQFEISAQSIKR